MIGAAILGTALAFVTQPAELAARPVGSVTIREALGYADVRNYGGSWYDWSGNPDRLVSSD